MNFDNTALISTLNFLVKLLSYELIRLKLITHIVEFKSRNESLESMERFGTYLISYDKILNGIEISRVMCVPFILIVYLIKDGVVIGIELGDEYGVAVPMEIKETRTQKSIDGGEAIRRNAYIDIEKFHILWR